MKTSIKIALLTLCGVLACSAGCGKNKDTASPPTKEIPTDALAEQSQKAANDRQKAEDERAAQNAAAAKQAAAAKASAATQEKDRIQTLLDTAKNLTGQNKYAEALKVIGELSKLNLSPDQQTLVDGLKKTAEQQAAKAVAGKAATDASKTVGDALGGKK